MARTYRASSARRGPKQLKVASNGVSTKVDHPYRGISFHKRLGLYEPQIKYKGGSPYLGKFENPKDAAELYDLAALVCRGSEFKGFNFPQFIESITVEDALQHLPQVFHDIAAKQGARRNGAPTRGAPRAADPGKGPAPGPSEYLTGDEGGGDAGRQSTSKLRRSASVGERGAAGDEGGGDAGRQLANLQSSSKLKRFDSSASLQSFASCSSATSSSSASSGHLTYCPLPFRGSSAAAPRLHNDTPRASRHMSLADKDARKRALNRIACNKYRLKKKQQARQTARQQGQNPVAQEIAQEMIDLDSVPCVSCGSPEERPDNPILMCDYRPCLVGCHLACCEVALAAVPEEAWYCSERCKALDDPQGLAPVMPMPRQYRFFGAGGSLTEYERQRMERIAQNHAVAEKLGIAPLRAAPEAPARQRGTSYRPRTKDTSRARHAAPGQQRALVRRTDRAKMKRAAKKAKTAHNQAMWRDPRMPQRVPVVCNGTEAVFLVPEHLVECGVRTMTPYEFETAVGCRSKKWKWSLRLKDGGKRLGDYLDALVRQIKKGL